MTKKGGEKMPHTDECVGWNEKDEEKKEGNGRDMEHPKGRWSKCGRACSHLRKIKRNVEAA